MPQSAYLDEFRRNWRILLAATIGLSGGVSINSFAQAVFAPKLLGEFGWTQSQFALLSLTSIPAFFLAPVIGRLTDVFGARRIILPVLLVYPFSWLGYLLIDGSFAAYIAAAIVHSIVGVATGSVVYSRVIAENFLLARGLALSVLMSGPSLMIAIGAPQLTRLVNGFSWQPGYMAMAAYSAAVGGFAFILLRRQATSTPIEVATVRAGRTWADYAAVLGARPFWIIFIGLFLCNIPNLLHAAQMKLMLLDRGASLQVAAQIISLYAVGVIVGRFACGLAVDRLPIVPVAVVALVLPGLGLLMIGLGVGGFWTLAFAMALVGLAQGAEGELAAMLALKHFGLDNFGTAYSLLAVNSIAATTIGALTLSSLLAAHDSFTLFILLGAATTLAGSLLLTLLRRERPQVALARA